MAKASTQAVTFKQQVRAMCGDRAALDALRLDIIAAAIRIAVKGNASHWMDGASEAATMKGTVAKAMQAGFIAVGPVAVLIKPQDAKQYTPEQRAEMIENRVSELVAVFDGAFKGAMPAPLTDAEKEAKKAEREAAKATAVAAAAEEAIKARNLVPADHIATDGELFNAFMDRVKAGKYGDALMGELRAALKIDEEIRTARAQGYEEGRAAAASLAFDAAVPTVAKARTKRGAKAGDFVGPMPAPASAAPATLNA